MSEVSLTGRARSPRPAEEVSLRWLFWLLAVAVAGSTLWVIWDESVTRRPWKEYQSRFNDLLASRGEAPVALGLRQVTNPDLGIVDRCESCHLGIDRPDLEADAIPPVFRTHPRRDQLLGKNHPPDRFGCTICHRGQGAQTKGVRGAAFDHGRNDPYWDSPMLTGVFAEASCASCHDERGPIPGASTYNRGRQLFADLACTGCHDTTLQPKQAAIAPPFDHLRQKTSRAFVEAWLRDPLAFRPDTRMPVFWPEPLDPTTGKPIESGPRYEAWRRSREQETAAIVAFLGSLAPRTPMPAPDANAATAGDGAVSSGPPAAVAVDTVAAGKRLFDQIGCRGCHSPEAGAARPSERGMGPTFAPNLGRIAEKASSSWLAAWIAAPRTVWADARMPNLDLSAEERATLLAFLSSLRNPGADPITPDWPKQDPALIDAGRDAVQRYGCYGCHDIPGFEHAANVGADLAGYGDKPADRLAWGDAKIACERTPLECWTVEKLARPHRFQGRDLISLMPDSALSEEDAVALAVFSLANRDIDVPPSYRRPFTGGEAALELGEAVIYRENCRGCHEIGRSEKRILDEDGELVEIEYTPNGATSLKYYENPALGPPPLTFAGTKFQPQWMFDFIAAPTRIRPWLVARMPTFALGDEDLTRLVEQFAARNHQPYPYDRLTHPALSPNEYTAAWSMFEKLQCTRCHQLSSAASLEVGDLAPDLALAATRLKHGWQVEWLLDPQRLQPGTKMPAYFPREDEEEPDSYTTPCPECMGGDVMRQVDALVQLTMELGSPSRPTAPGTQREPAK